jgi:hypothetical protein
MNRILAATTEGIYQWPDGTRSLNGAETNALALADDVRYAVAKPATIFRDDGEGWREVASVRDVRANCLIPSRAGLFVGTSEAHLLKQDGGRFLPLDTFESAPGRDEWFTPWGGPPDVRSLAETERGTLYCNVHVGGILRSQDGGSTWVPTIDVRSDVHEVTTAVEKVFAATAWGLATSLDEGASWEFDDQGLHATYARSVAVAGDVVVMSASSGPRGDASALYRRPLNDPGAFKRSGGELPEWFSDHIDTGCLSGLGENVAFGTEGGELFLSDDSGVTFTRVAENLAPVRWVELV